MNPQNKAPEQAYSGAQNQHAGEIVTQARPRGQYSQLPVSFWDRPTVKKLLRQNEVLIVRFFFLVSLEKRAGGNGRLVVQGEAVDPSYLEDVFPVVPADMWSQTLEDLATAGLLTVEDGVWTIVDHEAFNEPMKPRSPSHEPEARAAQKARERERQRIASMSQDSRNSVASTSQVSQAQTMTRPDHDHDRDHDRDLTPPDQTRPDSGGGGDSDGDGPGADAVARALALKLGKVHEEIHGGRAAPKDLARQLEQAIGRLVTGADLSDRPTAQDAGRAILAGGYDLLRDFRAGRLTGKNEVRSAWKVAIKRADDFLAATVKHGRAVRERRKMGLETETPDFLRAPGAPEPVRGGLESGGDS